MENSKAFIFIVFALLNVKTWTGNSILTSILTDRLVQCIFPEHTFCTGKTELALEVKF